MTDTVLTPLIQCIEAGNDDAAETLITDLARQPNRVLVPLLELAESPQADFRWWAVRGLAAIAARDDDARDEAVPILINALADDDESTRCAGALAVGQLRATSAIPSLILLLGDHSGWVRGAAADGLAMMGEAAVSALGQALQNENEGVRVRAAYALHKIGSPKSARWLFPALNDENYLVHTHAYEALDEMGLLTTVLVQ